MVTKPTGRPRGRPLKGLLSNPDRHAILLTTVIKSSLEDHPEVREHRQRGASIHAQKILRGKLEMVEHRLGRVPAWRGVNEDNNFWADVNRLDHTMNFRQRKHLRSGLPLGYSRHEADWLVGMARLCRIALTPPASMKGHSVAEAIVILANDFGEADFATRVLAPIARAGGYTKSLACVQAANSYVTALLSFGC